MNVYEEMNQLLIEKEELVKFINSKEFSTLKVKVRLLHLNKRNNLYAKIKKLRITINDLNQLKTIFKRV